LLGLRDRLPQLDAPDSDPFRALPTGAKFKPSIALFGREVIWKSSLTISAKPVGVGPVSQRRSPAISTVSRDCNVIAFNLQS
jgi:hypothetical protein